MRWPVFAVFAFLALILEVSLRNTLRLDSLHHGVSPSFMACLLAFVLLFAQRLSALWACWILGMMMDLLPAANGGDAHVIGPYALGYVFGGLVILPLRTMVFRRRPLTMAAAAFVFALSSAVVTVSLLTVRHWYPAAAEHPYSGMADLIHRGLEAVYSGILNVPLGWVLLLTLPLWGFQSTTQRRASWW